VRRWDRDRIQFLFAKPALDARIDVVSTLAIDPEHHWNAERLRKLATALAGVAGVLEPECSRGSSSASEA